MPFPYCIIDGTSYSFCTTSCIHVNLTKIALLLIEESITDSLYSGIFSFFHPAVSCRFRGAKIKPFISFHQILRDFFEWILLLNGACCFTHIWEDNSYRASCRCILRLHVSTSSYLTRKELFFKLFSNSHRSLFQHFIFIVAPSLESGCKSTWTFFSSKSYHHIPRVKLCLIADLQTLCKNEDRCFFIKTANSRGKISIHGGRVPLWWSSLSGIAVLRKSLEPFDGRRSFG